MASELIGALYPTQIPGYADIADIQAAFKLYHYGSLDYDTENTDVAELVNPSIAYSLNDLQDQILSLDPTGSVSKSLIDAKGDLIIGSADNTVSRLGVGSNNYVLMADNTQTLGIKWSALPTASTTGAGIVQLNDTYTSTSTTLAPTANALKQVYDKATTLGTTLDAGILQLTDSISSTSTSTAATPNSVKIAYDLASEAAQAGIPVVLMMMGG